MSLNAEQLKAATTSEMSLLVLAGAGSGKTKTLTARAVKLIRDGVSPKDILLLTFTRRAAAEMHSRIIAEANQDLSLASLNEMFIGTFHRFCFLSMVKSPKRFGFSRLSIIDGSDQRALIKLLIAKYDSTEFEMPDAKQIIALYSYSRNSKMVFHHYLKKFSMFSDQLSTALVFLINEYRELKLAKNYLDFDDILALYLEKLATDPDFEVEEKQRVKHILVDEMQDTNPIQWEILQKLRDPASLFVVGDSAQSIYAFRGADFKNVHNFTRRIPDAKVLQLNTNYRSSQEILDLANWLLAQSSLNYPNYQNSASGKSKNKPQIRIFQTPGEETRWVFKSIQAALRRGIPLSEIAVLGRSAYILRNLESYLGTARIPYRLHGGRGLFESSHIKDVLALLRIKASKDDDLAWMKYLTLWPKIGEKSAYKAIQLIKAVEETEVSQVLYDTFPKVPELTEAYTAVCKSASVPDTVAIACQMLIPKLQTIPTYKKNWRNRKKDLGILEETAQRYRSLTSFLNDTTLEPTEPSDDEAEKLTLSTIHSSKGMEFEVVFLLQIQPGTFPGRYSAGDHDAEEEERRMLYVAITRAKRTLVLTGAPEPHQFTNNDIFFLNDLPIELFRT